jgi:cytochrome c
VRAVNFIGILLLLAVSVGCGRNERMDLLYAERCLNCHGAGGRGDGPMAELLPVNTPDFRDTVQRKSNSQIRKSSPRDAV